MLFYSYSKGFIMDIYSKTNLLKYYTTTNIVIYIRVFDFFYIVLYVYLVLLLSSCIRRTTNVFCNTLTG